MFTIAIRPEDDNMTPTERAGWDAFRANQSVTTRPADADALEWLRGWFAGWARCFAEGVKASALDSLAGRDGESPYSQFSAQWEAWAEGYDSESTIPPPPADVPVILGPGVGMRCTLAEFLEANADGIGEEEASAIRVTIANGETYTGGGGAEAAFTVAPAPAQGDA